MVEMPEVVPVEVSKIRPNTYNPNEMDPDMFNELVTNIEEDGFIQPVAIRPVEDDPDGYEFEVIDGEHRFDGLKTLGVEIVPCYIRDIDPDRAKFLTVKMNRIKGRMNTQKFTALVRDLMERFTFDEVAANMAFTDPSELELMIENARSTIDDPDMKKAFDKAKGDIKTVDDLSALLNRLFAEYGDTVPANFMILDFGGKRHMWVRLKKQDFPKLNALARTVMGRGVTFDSFIMHLLLLTPVEKFVAKYQSELESIPEENESIGEEI